MKKKKRLSKAERKARAAAKKARAVLNARTPDEWRSAIDAITDPNTRTQAACIVWWDYFASRLVSEAWPHLDEYRNAWKVEMLFDQPKLQSALLQIGYSPNDALTRSTLPTTSQKVPSPS